jgi:hypothetical protein
MDYEEKLRRAKSLKPCNIDLINGAGLTKKEVLATKARIFDSSITAQDWSDIIQMQVQAALNGDLKAARFLLETRFGRAQIMNMDDDKKDDNKTINITYTSDE